jgi:hypothetical protein
VTAFFIAALNARAVADGVVKPNTLDALLHDLGIYAHLLCETAHRDTQPAHPLQALLQLRFANHQYHRSSFFAPYEIMAKQTFVAGIVRFTRRGVD